MSRFDLAANGGRGMWGKLHQRYAGHVARRGFDLNPDARLMLAALSRANNGGHAIFEPDELGVILGKVNGAGEVRPMSKSTQYERIKRLVSAGIAVEGSNPRCVWLALELWERTRRGTATAYCPVHKSRRAASALTPDWQPDIEGDIFLQTRTDFPGSPEDPEF